MQFTTNSDSLIINMSTTKPVSDIICHLEHLLQSWNIVIINLVSSDMAIELVMVILHLTAQVVDHVAGLLPVTVLVLKELGHVVNLVPVERLCALAGEAHGNNIAQNICQIQVITINLRIFTLQFYIIEIYFE